MSNKVALISGGSRGIGLEIAKELATINIDIAFIYCGNEIMAKKAEEELAELNVKAKGYKCNIADYNEVKNTVDIVLKDFGTVDILINNAGKTNDKLVMQMKENDFDEIIDINLKGAFNTIKHLYSNFIRKRSGKIINITSIVGLDGNAGQANYSSAKAGLIGLTKSVAKELGSRGICCNAVAPGFVETDMTKNLNETLKENIKNAIPLKRFANASEVAKVVKFLASDECLYITGQVIRVDGGLTI